MGTQQQQVLFNYSLKSQTLKQKKIKVSWRRHLIQSFLESARQPNSKESNSVIGFLQRNLLFTIGKPKPQPISPWPDQTLSIVPQYGVHTQTKGRGRSARYIPNRYRNMSGITDMLGELCWESLESRRTKIQITLLHKIFNHMVYIPASSHVTSASTRTRSAFPQK